MSHLVMIEALTDELWNVIEKYGDSLSVAAVIGILEVIKYEMLQNAGENDED